MDRYWVEQSENGWTVFTRNGWPDYTIITIQTYNDEPDAVARAEYENHCLMMDFGS